MHEALWLELIQQIETRDTYFLFDIWVLGSQLLRL